MKFFISDYHFGHRGLIEKMGRKGFDTIEEHDAALIENTNSKVDRKDILYILGDFGLPQMRHQIRCRHIFFILGNHDKRTVCEQVFGAGQVWSDKVIKLGDTKAVLYHYPTAYWQGSHHGWFHLYGHCHGQREATLDAIWPHRRSMEVSVDEAQRHLGRAEPFSETEVLDLIGSRKGHDSVLFYQGMTSGS